MNPMDSVFEQTLFAGNDVLVFGERGQPGTGSLAVSFSALTVHEVNGRDDTPDDGSAAEAAFAIVPLRRLGVHRVFFVARWRHGWQSPEMPAALMAARAFMASCGPCRVTAVGTSMGGYAALVFAAELQADGVLALAPHASVDLWRLRFDSRTSKPRFRALARRIAGFRREDGRLPHDDMTQTLASPIPKFLVFDATTHDRLHAERIHGQHVWHLPVFHVGHAVPTYLRETRVFPALLGCAMAGDGEGLQRQLARARRLRLRSGLFRRTLAAALQRRKGVSRLSAAVLQRLADDAARVAASS